MVVQLLQVLKKEEEDKYLHKSCITKANYACFPLVKLIYNIDGQYFLHISIQIFNSRHAHNVAFQKSDLFFICMLEPLSSHIIEDDVEIQAAKWMPLVEFVEQPLIKGDSMFKKIIDICVARMGNRYCGLHSHQVISKFDGRSSTLYYNMLESTDFNCQGI